MQEVCLNGLLTHLDIEMLFLCTGLKRLDLHKDMAYLYYLCVAHEEHNIGGL